MKKKKTFNISGVEYTDPHQAIAAIFSQMSICGYKKFVTETLLYCTTKQCYQDLLPASILLNLKTIKQILKLCHYMHIQNVSTPLKISSASLFDKDIFSRKKGNSEAWEVRPVVLDEEAFKNPYVAFGRVFSNHTVQSIYTGFEVMVDFASDTDQDDDMLYNTLDLYFILIGLLEALYLIDVREVFHINGRLR